MAKLPTQLIPTEEKPPSWGVRIALSTAILAVVFGLSVTAYIIFQPPAPPQEIQPEVELALESAELITPGFEVQVLKPLRSPDGNFTLQTVDGMELNFAPDGRIRRLTVNQVDLILEEPKPVFYALDAVTNQENALTGQLQIQDDKLTFLSSITNNLQLRAQMQSVKDHITVLGRLRGVTTQDRAITFSFRLPFDFVGGQWFEDGRAVGIEADQVYFNTGKLPGDFGYDLLYSRFPVSAIVKDSIGLGLTVPIRKPRPARLTYSSDSGYQAAFDFGLARETRTESLVPPNSADFEVAIFSADPNYGFRDVFAKYVSIYSRDFQSSVSAAQLGTQGPGLEYLSPRNIADYQMAWQIARNAEEAGQIRRAGLRAARYILPTELWIGGSFTEKTVLTPQEARNFIKDRSDSEEIDPLSGQPYQQVLEPLPNSSLRDPEGKEKLFDYQGNPVITKLACCPPFLPASVNPNPDIAEPNVGKTRWDEVEKAYQDPNISSIFYDRCDASTRQYTNPYDYRRENFGSLTFPLTFEPGVNKPAALLPLNYARFLQIGRITAQGKKSSICSFRDDKVAWWFAAFLDEFTTEFSGQEQMVEAAKFLRLLRLLAYQRPVNVSIEAPPLSEDPNNGLDYDQLYNLATHYGIFVGAGREKPEHINKFRLQAVKYLPVIRRLHQLRWEPLTMAHTSDADVWVERYGARLRGLVFTIYNSSDQEKEVEFFIDSAQLELTGQEKASETFSKIPLVNKVTGQQGQITEAPLVFPLPAKGLAIIEVR